METEYTSLARESRYLFPTDGRVTVVIQMAARERDGHACDNGMTMYAMYMQIFTRICDCVTIYNVRDPFSRVYCIYMHVSCAFVVMLNSC